MSHIPGYVDEMGISCKRQRSREKKCRLTISKWLNYGNGIEKEQDFWQKFASKLSQIEWKGCTIFIHKNGNNFNSNIDSCILYSVADTNDTCLYDGWCYLHNLRFHFFWLFDSIGQVCHIIIFTFQVEANTHKSHMTWNVCVCVCVNLLLSKAPEV